MPGRLALVVALVFIVSGCGSDVTRNRSLRLADCRLPYLATAAQCGTLDVPENRARADGRRISIFAAILPANTVSPKDDPLLILAGGPGQAASNLGAFASRLTELRRTRDIVLVDQRGTGRSSPLVCAAFKPRDEEAFETDPVPRARDCVAELGAKGVDLAQYTTTAWIADLEAMREALGYPRWNLWGGSYGTRVAQEYLRRHPDRVRTMTLDGVAPPSMIITLDVWPTREAALRAVLEACERSAACASAHPDAVALLSRIASDLGEDGRDVDLVDPRTGKVRTARITYDVVLGALQPLIYLPETASLLPEMLSLAAAGEYEPLFAGNPSMSGRDTEQSNAALHFSVTCAEDVPRIAKENEQALLANLPTRELALRTIAVCGAWPRGTMPADFAQPVVSDVPALLFSGGMDPVTPPAYGTEVAKTLRNSRHIVAPGYGHIVSAYACAPRLVAAFVDKAATDDLAPSCIAHFAKSVPPPVWSNRLAPAPP
jgi:pimeloyl-ACP methyl ester carboxylesterase